MFSKAKGRIKSNEKFFNIDYKNMQFYWYVSKLPWVVHPMSREGATLNYCNDRLYLFGGRNGHYINSIAIYDLRISRFNQQPYFNLLKV